MSRARALDQFYTARPVAAQCFKALQLAVEPRAGDFYLEPSAGDGAFYELMPKRRRLGLDLEPKHRGDSKLVDYAIGDEWFSHDRLVGTSEEKGLVDAVREQLRQPGFLSKYSDAYLIRNERDFSVFASDGRAFQPDFILMFSDKENSEGKAFQLFIEPKGEQLVEHDQWKEDALLAFDHGGPQGECVVYVLGLEFYQNAKGEEFWDRAELRVERLSDRPAVGDQP